MNMSQLTNQWIDIFRAHSGENGDFGEQDIQDMVNNFNPAEHEAPVVIGHPKTNGPAFGWVAGVRKLGDRLQARFKDVDPTFESMVREGKFKKRSASLYKTAKGFSLRHVGFLGAQPPVVKGLADISFSQEDNDAIEIEFSEGDVMPELDQKDKQSIIDGVIAGFKGLFQPKPGTTEIKSFSEAEVTALVAKAVGEATAATSAKIDALTVQFSERDGKLATTETRQRAETAILRVKAANAWVPAFDKMGVPLLFAELATKVETIEFGEGDAKQKKTPLDVFVDFMESVGKIVPNSPVYTGQQTTTAARSGGQKINARPGTVDEGSVKHHLATVEFAEKHKIGYAEAALKVAQDHPEIVYGGATTGAA